MVAATIVRRKQLIARGLPDPYALKNGVLSTRPSSSGSSTVSSFVLVDDFFDREAATLVSL